MFGTLHHVINTYQWLTGAQCCGHEELTGPPVNPDGNGLQYFSPHKPAFYVCFLQDTEWLKSLKY